MKLRIFIVEIVSKGKSLLRVFERVAEAEMEAAKARKLGYRAECWEL